MSNSDPMRFEFCYPVRHHQPFCFPECGCAGKKDALSPSGPKPSIKTNQSAVIHQEAIGKMISSSVRTPGQRSQCQPRLECGEHSPPLPALSTAAVRSPCNSCSQDDPGDAALVPRRNNLVPRKRGLREQVIRRFCRGSAGEGDCELPLIANCR
jgi:hypothetical protein